MSEKLQAAVKDSIAAAQRSGLKSKGDIASYVAQDPSVRAMARQSDGQLDIAALGQASRMNGLLRRYGSQLSVDDTPGSPSCHPLPALRCPSATCRVAYEISERQMELTPHGKRWRRLRAADRSLAGRLDRSQP